VNDPRSPLPIDVAVVGAGVAGLGVAWRLIQRGRRVVVVDRAEAGRGASWAAAGMLAPDSEIMFEEPELHALGRESRRRWPEFAAQLAKESRMDIGYDAGGTLFVADDRDAAALLRRLHAFQRERGLLTEWLVTDAALEREPLLSPRIAGAIWSPGDHRLDPRALVCALSEVLRLAGGLRENVAVASVQPGSPAAIVLEDGSRVDAAAVVVAAGAWTAGVGGLVPTPSVRPVKGQMVALRMTDALRLQHVVRSPRAYLVPRADGRAIVGSTMEDVGFDARVTAGGVYRVLDGAVRLVPAVEEWEFVETWSGLRPATRDNSPLLGRVAEGVWLATGHYRHGILLTPVTADEVAAEVDSWLAGAPETSPTIAPFSPGRSSLRPAAPAA
jgi:glycine oxidase